MATFDVDDRSRAQRALEQHFGFREFRSLQGEIVEHAIAGGDALVLMPTGGGKSLCFQVPSLVRQGTGIVVSPLIALMQDQVDTLTANGVKAAVLNSTLSLDAQRDVRHRLRRNELDLLYVAPERLMREDTLALLDEAPLALFAIDEAHCVSQWGHDFRPEYRQLGALARRFPHVPRLALTATADPRTRADIIEQLDLSAARVFIAGFDRPNIRYRIAPKRNAKQQLLTFLKSRASGESGIVYCLSRRRVDDVASWLRDRGYDALAYHAGLEGDIRAAHQRRFLAEEGVIVVATIAFGMGIDKPNVRFVAHLDLPRSVEAYYQETGRAGRDGLPSEAWMVYGFGEMRTLMEFISASDADETQKRIERTKLDAMLGLCETAQCRRRVLLEHFGESLDEDCGNCESCLEPPETFDGTLAAQQAMSAIYRTGQRFGIAHVIDVLRGGDSDKVARFQHDQLAVFGAGQDRSAQQWRAIIRQLIAARLVDINFEQYGALRLTDASRPVLRGEKDIRFVVERRAAERGKSGATRRAVAGLSADEERLFDALRELRMQIAKAAGVPPYVVFGDAALQEMAVAQPKDAEAFLAVSGVGPHKLDRYGPDFMAAIIHHAGGDALGSG